MRREELAFAIDLAAQEGWNPGIYDAECFFAADSSGFLIAELLGEPVGCVSAVSYAGRYGFLGLYIVHPQFRGRGFGMRLWDAAMARLRGHNVGLDGVVAQQDNYARSGFRLAYRNVRYRGQARRAELHASVLPAGEAAFDEIGEYDRQIFPERRDAFLRSWLAQPMARTYVARNAGRPTGYAVVRRCREGWKIGPLAADDAVIARRLYEAAAAYVPDRDPIFVDVPDANPRATSFLAALNLTPVFETARMYTGPDPAIDLTKLFGVTTLELG
jgi:ribosomal protein S18 acetylase RimI-like enzyme